MFGPHGVFLSFNSRTHGKHSNLALVELFLGFQFPHTRETYDDLHVLFGFDVSIPAHTGNIGMPGNP